MCLSEQDRSVSEPEIDSLIDRWPYTVSIQRDGQFICGGTIINPEWIITVGHCVYGYDEKGGYYYHIQAGIGSSSDI